MRIAAVLICMQLAGAICFAGGTNEQQNAAFAKRLDSIIFPSIELNQANVNDVGPYLAGASKQFDPAGKGVRIVVQDRENEGEINLNEKNISLHKALTMIAQMTGLALVLEEDAAVLRRGGPGK